MEPGLFPFSDTYHCRATSQYPGKMPPQFGTFKQAQRVKQADAEQVELGLG
jgi:hypothetical protein